jgi:hypothetical protein
VDIVPQWIPYWVDKHSQLIILGEIAPSVGLLDSFWRNCYGCLALQGREC